MPDAQPQPEPEPEPEPHPEPEPEPEPPRSVEHARDDVVDLDEPDPDEPDPEPVAKPVSEPPPDLPSKSVASPAPAMRRANGRTKQPRPPSPVREAPPPKVAKTSTKRKPDPTISTSNDGWPANCLAKLVLRDFVAAKANAKDIVFGPTASHVFNVRGDYRVVVKKRQDGRSVGSTDAYVYLEGHSKRVGGVSQLRSVPEIVRHFNGYPELNKSMFRAHGS
jgi:hypothetical protein